MALLCYQPDICNASLQVIQQMQNSVVQQLPDAAGLPVVGLSATSGLGLGRLLPVIERLHKAWNQRIPTSKLNAWSTKVGPCCITSCRRRLACMYAVSMNMSHKACTPANKACVHCMQHVQI